MSVFPGTKPNLVVNSLTSIINGEPKPKHSIVLKTATRFPANIVSSEGVKIDKGDGTYVFSLDYPNLAPASEISTPSLYTVAVYNNDKEIYEEVRLDDIPLRDPTNVATNVGDVNYTIAPGKYYVALNAALTVSRTWTLPLANLVPPGNRIRIQDQVGGVSTSNNLIVVPTGSDTINGVASYTLTSAYAGIDFVSNGTNGWTRVEGKAGADGNTGPTPWSSPVAWAASTAYVVGPPASCVIYSGGSYICKTAHTSSATFDLSKWTMIADPGNAQAAQSAATAAAASASSANSSYIAANTSAGEAASSASAALSSKASAETAATNAASSASTASTKANEAAASASSASTSATTATTKASEASTSATNAASSATASASSAASSASSASASSASATLAQNWATQTSSEVVVGQGYGAKKYAQDAASSASSAATSATTAQTYAASVNTSLEQIINLQYLQDFGFIYDAAGTTTDYGAL